MKNPANSGPFSTVSAKRQNSGLGGGRTRARTWDPLIKSHAAGLDFSREFFQLNQKSDD
jgi:hypothetical protein